MNQTPLHFLAPLTLPFLALLIGCQSGGNSDNTADWCANVESHMGANEAGAKVWAAIESHGGLETFLDAGVLNFRWTYNMRDKGSNVVVDTVQQIHPKTMQATHQVPGTNTTFGWTGSSAWIHPAEAKTMVPPRFWALTPYYFVGIPFVFADLNAKYEMQEPIEFEGTSYEQVKVTYKPGAGDAPDDYYILLIHPETGKIAGARYIVTSKLVAKEGPLPEKLITLEQYSEVGPVSLPTFHRSFTMEDNKVGDEIRDATTSEYKWLSAESVDFSVPDGAKEM